MPQVRREPQSKQRVRRTRSSGTELHAIPSYWQRHSIGVTIAATLAAALALSSLPLPDSLRPFPLLTSAPLTAIQTALWPKRSHEPPQPAGAEGNEPAERAMVFDEMDLTGDEPGKSDDREVRRWESLIKGAQAAHTAIEDPCVTSDCSKTALTPFFAALRGLSDGTATESVRVVTLGTSLIASDHITDVTRRLLQTRHGSGGLGFMFVDRPTRNAGRTVRSGSATGGWVIEKVTDTRPLRAAGLGGVAFFAPGEKSQETTFLASGTRRADLFLVTQPGGGGLRVIADGSLLGEFATGGAADRPLFHSVKIPANVTRLTLKTFGGPVRLDGVVLENANKGVVFDSIGLPGATAQVLLREDAALFQAQLEQRKPSLVVLMIGGNDAFDLSVRRYTPARAQESMQELITRVKAAVPDSACLLAAPPDAGIWRMDKTIATRKETRQIGAIMKELAKANGCAYWDMQAAMGGEGSVARWWGAGLMNRDLVHPLGTGGDVMGYMLDTALEQARAKHDAAPKGTPRGGRAPGAHPRPAGRAPHVGLHSSAAIQGQKEGGGFDGGGGFCQPDGGMPPPPFLSQPEALRPFFSKLKVLEQTGSGRVAIAQMGASHTAAQYFTDEVRRLFADRFGYAGRGFVAAGKSSNRLEAAGVARSLFGPWRITDALAVKTSGLTWGLTGIRAEASPGASMEMSFDEPGAGPDDFSRVQVYYLDQPDGGTPEVRIDGKVIQIPRPTEPMQSAVRVLELGVPGSKHLVSVSNPGPGPLSIFGVSHELIRPGIVYDALGLPGSTATTLASYAQQPLAQQLEARQVDLFVLFYGTNESSLSTAAIEEMKRSYPGVIGTLRLSNPEAACLFLGPTDRMSKKGGKGGWKEVESINEVQAALRQIAAANGCGFWSTREVMGGKDSIAAWRKQKLANKDHVHLTEEGYQKLAGILFGDLMQVYDAWSPPP